MNLLEILMKLLSGDTTATDQLQRPQQPPPEPPQVRSLRDRMAQYRFPPRRPDDLSGMGY